MFWIINGNSWWSQLNRCYKVDSSLCSCRMKQMQLNRCCKVDSSLCSCRMKQMQLNRCCKVQCRHKAGDGCRMKQMQLYSWYKLHRNVQLRVAQWNVYRPCGCWEIHNIYTWRLVKEEYGVKHQQMQPRTPLRLTAWAQSPSTSTCCVGEGFEMFFEVVSNAMESFRNPQSLILSRNSPALKFVSILSSLLHLDFSPKSVYGFISCYSTPG